MRNIILFMFLSLFLLPFVFSENETFPSRECQINSDCGEIRECGITWTCIEGKCYQLAIDCVPSCDDTDGGKQYYTKGQTRELDAIASDICQGNKLKEYYCDGSRAKSEEYECPNGCKDGTCITEKPTKTCTTCLNGNPTGKYDENGCMIYECPPIDKCELYYKECSLGNKVACKEYKENCIPEVEDDCYEYMIKCKEGNVEKCEKYKYKCIQISTCGNGICEDKESTIICRDYIDESGECTTLCPQDCKEEHKQYIKLNQKFEMKVGSEAIVTDYNNIEIKLLGIHKSGCDTKEIFKVPDTFITGLSIEDALDESTFPEIEVKQHITFPQEVYMCKGGQLIAGFKIKMDDEKFKFSDIKLGEKKEILGVVISFLDYTLTPGKGLFLITKSEDATSCPKECICTLDGSVECPRQKCLFGYKLCPDGQCKFSCDIENIEECKFGCLYNENSCLPIGTRLDGKYCSITRDIEKQRESNEKCENNFECKTNSCLDGSCTEPGFWQKLFKLLSFWR